MDGNFKQHNQEVKRVWESYAAGTPCRIPMIIGVNPRYLLLDPRLNPMGVTFQEYFEEPEVMFQIQLEFQDFVRHHIFADHEMGIPENGWQIAVDFQNTFESAWLGAPIVYREGNCPACQACLDDDHKALPLEKGLPEPFSGLMGTVREYKERFEEKRKKGFTYKGVPVASVTPAVMYTDGPFTLACNLRGVDNFCIDMYEDPEYARQLLDYITDATIQRLRAWRRYMGQEEVQPSFFFADDCIALLSPQDYREWVFPCHRKLVDSLSTSEGGNGIHLCGDASHHFKWLADQLKITSFDTGYPIDHRKVARELGPDIQIQGGPTASLLFSGTEEAVVRETERILDAVKDVTKRFILREANNLSPKTPLKNIEAMYRAVRQYGVYEDAF